jgi:hypothetical protein
MYKLNKQFITKYATYESNKPETRKFMMSVKEFYDEEETEINKGCLVNDSITRYYVFRKKDVSVKEKSKKQSRTKVTKVSKKKLKGGADSSSSSESDSDNSFKLDLSNTKEYFVPNLEVQNNSLFRSIHEVLQSHKIIPKSEKYKDFYKSLNIKIPRSTSKVIYDKNAIEELGNKIVIQHELENGSFKKVLEGISVITVEKSENKYNIDKPSKLNKANILLLKEGDIYTPIYKLDKEFDKKGLFKNSEDFIKNLCNID